MDQNLYNKSQELSSDATSQALLIIFSIVIVQYYLKSKLANQEIISDIIPESSISVLLGVLISVFMNYGLNLQYLTKQLSDLNDNLVILVILPPIIYSTALNINLTRLWRNMGTILIFAIFGTILSALLIAVTSYQMIMGIMGELDSFTVYQCMVFGSILAASDTVAVLSAFSKVKVNPNLVNIVIGESLINDAVTIVLQNSLKNSDTIIIENDNQMWIDQFKSQWSKLLIICLEFGISAIIGMLQAMILSQIFRHKRKQGFFQKLSLNLIVPYMSQFTAQAFGYSGITSILFCGLLISLYAKNNMSVLNQEVSHLTWETMSYFLENYSFILIGFNLISEFHSGRFFSQYTLIAIALQFCVFVCRFIVVSFLGIICNLCRNKNQMSLDWMTVLTMGNLKGCLSYLLALDSHFVGRDDLKQVVQVIVVLSLLLQGAAITPLFKNLNLAQVEPDNDSEMLDFHLVQNNKNPYTGIKFLIYELHLRVFMPMLKCNLSEQQQDFDERGGENRIQSRMDHKTMQEMVSKGEFGDELKQLEELGDVIQDE